MAQGVAKRPSPSARGYDAAWRKLRLVVLAGEPICRECKRRFANEVDHIIPISQRPDLRLVRSNLRPLCKTCHSKHTAATQGLHKDHKQASGADASGQPTNPGHHWNEG